MNRSIFILLIIVSIKSIFCQNVNTEMTRKSTLFLGIRNGNEFKITATAFLVYTQNVFCLITAKHVVMEELNGNFTGKLIDENLCAIVNIKNSGYEVRPFSAIKKRDKINWVFHKKPNVDIAMIPFGIDTTRDNIRFVPESNFLSIDTVFETYDVFFLSYQDPISIQKQMIPIFRFGTISLINNDKSFYIDAFAFPGNSGSPVFLKPNVFRYIKGTVFAGEDPIGGKFIGIIGAYLPYQEVAISQQTGRPRVMFEENTGLALVWSTNYIKDIIQSAEFKNQATKLLSK